MYHIVLLSTTGQLEAIDEYSCVGLRVYQVIVCFLDGRYVHVGYISGINKQLYKYNCTILLFCCHVGYRLTYPSADNLGSPGIISKWEGDRLAYRCDVLVKPIPPLQKNTHHLRT